MSELALQESSDLENSSSDDELNMINKQASNYNFKKMILSTDKVDKRLYEQNLILKTHRKGVSISHEKVAEVDKIVLDLKEKEE